VKVRGIVVEPKAKGKYPVVIFNRGGNRSIGRLTIETLIGYTSKLAEQGYVIIGSNYRENDEFGGTEINDVLNLTETVKEIDKADPNCIGMFGWSRGGMMTYLALQKSENIKTAIIGNGPTDLFGLISDRPKMESNVIAECVPNYSKKKESELKKRSVIYWADKLDKNSSILILCGTNDKRVNPNQSDKIAQKLTEINYDFELKKYETDHYFTEYKDELNELVINWFDNRLKTQKPQ
jgi:dipeptidyl aminopeptidase/acylaminoacyl peptidase